MAKQQEHNYYESAYMQLPQAGGYPQGRICTGDYDPR